MRFHRFLHDHGVGDGTPGFVENPDAVGRASRGEGEDDEEEGEAAHGEMGDWRWSYDVDTTTFPKSNCQEIVKITGAGLRG